MYYLTIKNVTYLESLFLYILHLFVIRNCFAMTSVQAQIQQDWDNREFIEIIAESIKKITEFLNAFDLSARSRLSQLNEKLTTLERQVDYIEARITKG